MSASSSDSRESGGKPDVSAVLFVCGMNAIRSPMAERLLKAMRGDRIYCDSAGAASGEVDGFALAVMEERGLGIPNHTPKSLDDLDDAYFDLIVTLSPEAHHRALDFAASASIEVEYWPTMDPSTIAGTREQVLDAYRQVRDTLEQKIRQRFGK